MFDMFTFILLCAGMALAAVTGWAIRVAQQLADDYRATRTRLPGLKKVRNSARFRVGFLFLLIVLFMAFVNKVAGG